MGFYFSRFENRKPPEPLETPRVVKILWQIMSVAALVLGANYIRWRWMESLNMDALWYALPLVIAETCAWIGTVLFTINLWREDDPPQQPAPLDINDCLNAEDQAEPRPVRVDLFIATYSEDVELVRLSIQDALKMRYPGPLDYRIHALDDGRRPAMRAVCEEEGVNYITRETNIGFKAGNLRNGLEQTDGDFIVICDADTRVFPTLLEHTLGYFRDPDVAWVQTPQWFFDLPEGERLPRWLSRKAGKPGYALGWLSEKIVGPVTIGRDPFFNDPRMFYDVILRRRNWADGPFAVARRRCTAARRLCRRRCAAMSGRWKKRLTATRAISATRRCAKRFRTRCARMCSMTPS